MADNKNIKFLQSVNNSPVLSLAGLEIEKFNFQMDDCVRIEVSKNKIVITKDKQTEILRKMNLKNHSLIDLVEKFNLETVL